MIPKKIHYCWIGGNPLPELAIKCIESWKKYCPDYEIIEWNESNYDFHKNRYMGEAYDEKKWGFVPDYARLDIIYEYGGVYLDTDVEMLKPFDDLLNYQAFAGMEKPGMVALGLGFGAEPHNPLIKEMMEYYEGRSFYNENGSLDTAASPRIQTATLLEHGLKEEDVVQEIDGMKIYSCEYFCPESPFTGKTEITANSYSVHHYMGSWLSPLDKIIFNIGRKFDKRKKTLYIAERLCTLPFRVIRKVKKKGIKGAVDKAKEQLFE